MSLAGAVRVQLLCDSREGRVRAAEVALLRPSVAPLLIGRTPDQAIDMVSALHSVCGAAHRLAATRALCDARGVHEDARERRLERAVLVEIALDHLCRLYLDWPEAIGLPPQPAQAAGWRRRLADPQATVATADVDAVRRQADALLDGVPRIAGIRQRLLRRARKTIACLTAIKQEPERPGKIRTLVTPPAAAAAAARAGASIVERQWQGEGRTYTARGELIHRVSLTRSDPQSAKVAAWAIDAPTDRLFVPDGPVARALMRLQGSGASLRRLARFVVLSFDPCVESRIDLGCDGVDDARDGAGAGNT
jgi:Ni,Fe-hydrogenase I large subunit